ncbi:conserved hypothetical protein [Mesorhizobium ventifaucium]|uniref:Alpha-1,2-fucosyltransferase n=1 Tax=Mesorhizobium ventifaucium TaxID=666020 RepID=A0ABM9DJ41_9HYPH|nr:conserved hypothetical protein [Mesorhizobium ventifaucium]
MARLASHDELTRGGPWHLPVLSRWDAGVIRSPGPGLGNLLFPIARALIGQKVHGGVFIHPTLRQLKLGTFLRRERDTRTYGNVIRSRTGAEWRDWAQAQWCPKVDEDAYRGEIGVAVRYSGLKSYFHDLAGHGEIVSAWLKDTVRGVGVMDDAYDIGLHIRLGDFAQSGSDQGGNNVRLPFDWYRAALAEARRLAGTANPRTTLFTDGDVNFVKRELGIPDLTMDPSGNALTAMHNLSRARVVIASRSTFSMWAVYLGGMPAIWDGKFDLQRGFPGRPGLDHRL